jgi:hypothetical protein
MPTTPAGIRYPSSSDSINIPGDLEKLALDVDTYVTAQVGANVTPSNAATLTNKTIGSTGLFFEGSTDDGFETLLTVVDPTADRTITLPNVSGTVITTGNLTDVTDLQSFTGTIVFEGTTADAFELTLSAGDPTADRTVTLPDATTTLVGTDTTQTLTNKTLASPTFTGQVTGLELAFSQSIVFEGTTADAFETTLTAGEPTADRTITLPDSSGTVALQADVTTATNLVVALEIAVIMAAF